MKIPMSFIIDDPSPVLSVYYAHHKTGETVYGTPIIREFPNSFLFEFCDIIEKWGIKGKFSVVPMPGNMGDIINGIEGVNEADLKEWLDTVKKRVVPNFSICPEILSHNKAVDLATGEVIPMRENEWSQTQDRTTLTPYISKSLSILKEAGFDCCGVTSPWNFGAKVIDEYTAAVSEAMYDIYGKENAWYFLHYLRNTPNAKPWIALEEDGRTLVAIPATTGDHIWKSLESPRTDDEFISEVADLLITADGKSGEIIEVIESGGFPILLTHWQSLASNGLYTGLKIFNEVGKRITENLSDKIEWVSAEEMMELVLKDKNSYREKRI